VIRLAVCLLCLCTALPAVADTVIRHIRGESAQDARNDYFLAMLTLALEKTAEEGPWQLQAASESMPQSRALTLLREGQTLDIVWSMTSIEREQQHLAVRIPLMKGLMGYRLLLIRAEDQPWFRRVQTLDQLRELRAGQGHDWPDTEILRHNGLSVEGATDYDSLFRMLQLGRFDYLPRAINEPWEETAARPDMKLAVESGLLLHYPTAEYFFFHRDNTELAQRIERGLRRAINDGSFDQLFHGHPINANAFGKANLLKRRIIRLDNPLLPPDTPFDQQELWWPGSIR
jgi:hypothetical protein